MNLTTGIVSSLVGFKGDQQRFQITAPVQPGNSGGPVLDRSGRVVGVVVGKLDDMAVAQATGQIPQNVNFAIKASPVRMLMDRNAVRAVEAGATSGLSVADVGDLAKGFVVPIECWN